MYLAAAVGHPPHRLAQRERPRHEGSLMTNRKRGLRRTIVTLLACLSLLIGGVAASAAASAATWQLMGSNTVTVPESSSGVPVYLTFNGGEQARVTCTGSVWGGVWLTGTNTADGWAGSAPSTFPMPGSAGGRSFAAIARFTTGGGTTAWSHVGTAGAMTAPGWGLSQVEVRVNDNAPGNGSGSFSCRFERWRLI
jgi:hypothetical protein